MLPRSKRRTMPEISSPFLSRYWLKTFSRSVELEQRPVLAVLLLRLGLILVVVEDLKEQLVAHVGLQVETGRLLQGDLLGWLGDGVRNHDNLREVHPSGRLVEGRLHFTVLAEGALGRGEDGLLEGLDQHLALDVLVLGNLVQN
jgi:hypothetical protein